MQIELLEHVRPPAADPVRHAEERLRTLELEQTRLLARHEAVVSQLASLRSSMRDLERLLELRLQRLEQLRRVPGMKQA